MSGWPVSRTVGSLTSLRSTTMAPETCSTAPAPPVTTATTTWRMCVDAATNRARWRGKVMAMAILGFLAPDKVPGESPRYGRRSLPRPRQHRCCRRHPRHPRRLRPRHDHRGPQRNRRRRVDGLASHVVAATLEFASRYWYKSRGHSLLDLRSAFVAVAHVAPPTAPAAGSWRKIGCSPTNSAPRTSHLAQTNRSCVRPAPRTGRRRRHRRRGSEAGGVPRRQPRTSAAGSARGCGRRRAL